LIIILLHIQLKVFSWWDVGMNIGVRF
jgi:hypothetical protein